MWSRHFIFYLQLSLLNAPSDLIKVNLLSRSQCLLQGCTNLNCLDSIGQLHRERNVVKAGRRELVGLRDKSSTEASHKVGRDLTSDSASMIKADMVTLGVVVDGELALRADDLGGIFLTMGHHATAVVVSNFTVPEFDNPDGIVIVLVFLKFGLHRSNAVSGDALGNYIVAEEPKLS